jgi:hypothetical protein
VNDALSDLSADFAAMYAPLGRPSIPPEKRANRRERRRWQIIGLEARDTRKESFSRHLRIVLNILYLPIAMAELFYDRRLARKQRECSAVKAADLKCVDCFIESLGVVECSNDFADGL